MGFWGRIQIGCTVAVALALQVISASAGVNEIRAEAENRIRSQMIDPESTRFESPFEFAATKEGGFYTCGRVNAKNRMGGYAGASWFSVATKDGQIINIQLEDTSPWIVGPCVKAARKGELKPRANQ